MELKIQEKYIELLKLFSLSIIVGFLGFSFSNLILLLYPMLFMESSIKNGIVNTMATMLGVSVLLGLFTDLVTGLSLFFIFGPMILAFHYGVTSGKNYKFIILIMFLALIISFMSYQMGVSQEVGPINLEELMEKTISAQIEALENGMSRLEISKLEETLKSIFEIALIIMPSVLIILGLCIVYFSYTLAARRLIFKGLIINQPPTFPVLHLSRNTILGLGLGILLALVLKYTDNSLYKDIYMNVIVLFGFLYLVNGLALQSFILFKFRLPMFLKTIIFTFSIIFTPITLFIIFTGLVDSLVNFRQLKIRRE